MSELAPQSYLRQAILSATPEQLHLMLIDGAIRFALQGRDALLAQNWELVYEKFSRAQKIILEMQSGLRPEVNRELCERMAALYDFLYRKLIEANINRDLQAVDDAVKILRMQRETWLLLMEKVRQVRADESNETETAEAAAGSLCLDG